MKYISTRTKKNEFSLSVALSMGVAPDGGLFVPKALSKLKIENFKNKKGYHEIAYTLLEEFFKDDPLSSELNTICQSAFNFPIPLTKLDEETHLLELYHGPTAAFKDVGARFLAECFARIEQDRTILVATSGDTGGAVASAFFKRRHCRVAVLFPAGGVSPFQEHQLSCWGENIISLKVAGDFDDCQKLVKAAFANSELCKKFNLTSANSINLGRLLPQMTYYASSSFQYFRQYGRAPSYVVPTGNMGNVMAAIWCKLMGLPIEKIVMACNANHVIPDYFKSHVFTPVQSQKTLANAMDVGNPSNMERYLNLAASQGDGLLPDQAYSICDEEIKSGIIESFKKYNKILCPHTVTAWVTRQKLPGKDWIVVATAHPAKFAETVAAATGQKIILPPALQTILNREVVCKNMNATLSDLENNLK